MNEDLKLSLVDTFESLESGWAGADSVPPNSAAISQARQFIHLLPSDIKLLHISVVEDGEINFF